MKWIGYDPLRRYGHSKFDISQWDPILRDEEVAGGYTDRTIGITMVVFYTLDIVSK